MRRITAISVIAFALLLTACSVTNIFVVVNASDRAIEVRYKVRYYASAPNQLPAGAPSIKPISQIGEQVAWQELSASRYKIDPDNRTVVLTLNPGEALLLKQCPPADGASAGDCESTDFTIDEIALVGANGEINLKGEQAHKSFVAESKQRYTLTYE